MDKELKKAGVDQSGGSSAKNATIQADKKAKKKPETC